MPKIRALVVDDAVVMRRLLTEVLQRDSHIEVVGTAPNGRIALQKLPQLAPDVVTLDMEMPDMDGIATLKELRRTYPRLPVIMFSLATRQGASATLDALAAGASDYVTKPVEVANLAESIARLEQDLLPKIRAHFPHGISAAPEPAAALLDAPPVLVPPPARPRIRSSATSGRPPPVDLVCIATSTGGPNALATVFASFTQPIRVPVAIVQHMPPMFTQLLAERLNSLSPHLRCREAVDGDEMEAGCAYLAPGGRHLEIERIGQGRYATRLTDAPPENSCRPAADVLFRAAARSGASLLGVVMTGMGQDGLRGCEFIAERRGQIIAEDKSTCVVWGMPRAVAEAGLAQAVVPLQAIAAEIQNRIASLSPTHA